MAWLRKNNACCLCVFVFAAVDWPGSHRRWSGRCCGACVPLAEGSPAFLAPLALLLPPPVVAKRQHQHKTFWPIADKLTDTKYTKKNTEGLLLHMTQLNILYGLFIFVSCEKWWKTQMHLHCVDLISALDIWGPCRHYHYLYGIFLSIRFLTELKVSAFDANADADRQAELVIVWWVNVYKLKVM